MDATKMLVSVSTIAIGWMAGLWAYKTFMGGGNMTKTSTNAPSPSTPSFGYDGDDD